MLSSQCYKNLLYFNHIFLTFFFFFFLITRRPPRSPLFPPPPLSRSPPLAGNTPRVSAAPLPPPPAGAYHVFADVVHETGFERTLATTVQVPAPPPATIRYARAAG